VVQDPLLGEPHRRGDGRDAGGAVPVLGEQGERGIEDLPASQDPARLSLALPGWHP
jgi:hypothetical protein